MLALVATLASTATYAVPTNLVFNGSFEAAFVNPNPNTYHAGFNGNVPYWGGTGVSYILSPGQADDGPYFPVYGPFPNHSPDGGNFVEANGETNPGMTGAIFQGINGLTVGQKYVVSFYQAAGQQVGFTGPTTERWLVSLGNETIASSTISLPQGGVGNWEKQSLIFKATSVSEQLLFLANGAPNGSPPISFLDGVTIAAVPEPAAMALLGLGIAGFAIRRRRSF